MTGSFTVTRTFDAPRELVWDAWTTPEHFAVWFGTEMVPVDGVSLDVKPGGMLKATMYVPDGPVINWEGEYTEVDRPSRLAFTLTDNPGEYAGLPIVATFTEVDGGTEVSLTQTSPEFSEEQVQATIAGYNAFYDSLAALLATLKA